VGPAFTVKTAQLLVELPHAALGADEELLLLPLLLLLLLLELEPPPQAAANTSSKIAAASIVPEARLCLSNVICGHSFGQQRRNVGVSNKAAHMARRFHNQSRGMHYDRATALAGCLNCLRILIEVGIQKLFQIGPQGRLPGNAEDRARR
jgi:hypothetical protein